MSRGPRRYGVAFVIVGVVVASLAGAAVRAGSAATPRPSVLLSAQVPDPRVVPGGDASVLVTATNTGRLATASGQPLVFRVAAPLGLRFRSAANVAALRGLGDFPHPARERWSCRTSGGGSVATCVEPAALAAGQGVGALLRFAAPKDLRAGAAGSFVVGVSGAASGSARARVRTTAGTPSPTLFVNLGGSKSASADRAAVETVDVLNVGSGAATSIRLTNLLPPSVVGAWSAAGRGWTCTGGAGTPPACSTSASVGVDAVAPRLTITYRLDAAKVALLRLPVGGAPSLQRFEIGVAAGGGSGTNATATGAAVAVAAPPGAVLVPTAYAGHGEQELLPGTSTSVHVKVANVGNGATTGVGVIAIVPVGTSITGATAGWTCTPDANVPQQYGCLAPTDASVPPGGAARFDFTLAAAIGAAPAESTVTLSALAANQTAGAKLQSTTLPLVILKNGTGFPALTLWRTVGTSALAPVVDGSAAELLTGGSFTERLDVRNAGSAPLLVGEHAELTQDLGRGVTARLESAPPGWSCAVDTAVRCTLDLAANLDPAASLTGPTIVLTAADPTNGEASWPAAIRLTRADAPPAGRVPVLVDVTRGTIRLVPNFTATRLPTAGGTGSFSLVVSNRGDAPSVDPVRLGLHLPAGVRVEQLTTTAEWRCEVAPSKDSASCTSARPAPPGVHLAQIALALSFGARTWGRTLTLVARAADGARAPQSDSIARMQVVPRHGLAAVIGVPDRVAFADQPLVSASESLKPTVLTLRGDGSGGSGMGLTYTWTQRCTTAADAALRGSGCRAVTPPVQWLGQPAGATRPTTPNVEFQAPSVTKPTWLVFDLAVTDGSATSTTSARVRVLPLPSGSKGFNLDHAHPHAEKPIAPSAERRRLPKPAERLTPPKPAPKPKRDQATPTDTNPTPTTTSETTTSSTTTSSTTTSETTTTTTTTAPPPLPALFCTLVDKALAAGGSFSASLPGGVDLHLSDVKVHGSACDPDTTVTFGSSSFSLHSYLSASGVSGTISADGISIGSGTIAGPDAWNTPTFAISKLDIAYGSDVSVEGSVTADGFGFVPLPSGWKGTTSLDFAAGSGGTSVSVNASAKGPTPDASPDSAAPSVSVNGSVGSDGTFDLAVSIQRVVQLAGSSVSVSGHVVRSSPDGAISTSLEGSLDAPIQIVPGLAIQTLTVKAKPTSDSLNLEANGSLRMSVGSNALDVGVKLTYDNPKNWSLTAAGEGDSTWTPVTGLTLAAKDFSGSIVAKNDAYELTLHAALSNDWKPTSSVTVSHLELNLSNVCREDGGPCPSAASLFLDLKGDVSFDLPSVGTVTTKLAGSLALPTGEFSVSAELANPISVGAGITIDRAKVAIEHGLPANPEDPSAESADGGEFRVDLSGGISVPGLGALPTVHASFSSKGWAVAVPLGGFSLPGASGDGSQLGSTVLGWASYATSMNVYDAASKQVVKISLPAGGFKITGSFTTPAWLRQTLHLPGDINGRATGLFDPEHDTYSLRMDFAVPGQPYLYGSAGSATNIKLNSVFFQIERKSGDFNLALGGAASLNVAATSELPASSADLSLELSYAISAQTVAGSLSLTSQNGWRDAFGTKDLTLYGLSLAFSFNIPTLTPGIGFGASAVLPTQMQNRLGMVNGARTTVVANISVDKPCVGFQVDDPTNTGQTVLNIGNGAVTAKQFEFDIAPFGCTVGDFHYDPGLSLQFDGTVAGVSLAVYAHVSVAPFAFDGTVDLGEFSVGGLTVKQTHVEVALSPSKLNVTFSGGVEVFGTNVDISGSVSKQTAGTTANFKGSLDQLSLGGGVVSAKNLKVTVHIETGAKNALDFAASGAVQVLGANATGTFSLSLANGQLNAAHADLRAAVNFGGGTGLTLNGTFKADYTKGQPFSLDGNVKIGIAGQSAVEGTVSLKPGYLALGVKVQAGSFFTADLSGAVYYGSVPAGTKIPTPNGDVAAQTGDYYVAAKDVTLNVGGFAATGSVSFGKAGSTPFGSIAAKLQLTGSASDNSVSVSGSFNGLNDITLTGSAQLSLSSFSTKVDVTVRRTPQVLKVTGAASLNVVGSTVDVNGQFQYANGQYQFKLTGTGTLRVGGYTLANAFVKFSNFPEDAGLKANVSINAGSVVSVQGWLNVEPGGLFSFTTNANVDLHVTKANLSVSFANYGQVCRSDAPAWFDFRGWLDVMQGRRKITTSCSNVTFPARLQASGTVSASGFSFGVSMTIGSDGTFNASARTPVNGETTLSTGTLDLLVVRGYAEVSYHFELALSNNSPWVSVDGKGSARVLYQYWSPFSWSGWDTLFGASLSLRTDPFRACASATIVGKDFEGCVP